MKLKLDEEGHAVLEDGKPVYIHDDGKEAPFDAAHTVATITRLQGEAKGHREAKEAAEKALKTYEGIEDAEVARKALETVKNLDDKKLVDAGEVEKVKAEAIKALEEQYKPVIEERDRFKSDLYREKIGGSFARSKFIADKIAVPAPMIEKTFGDHFAIEGGAIVAKDASGNQIYSKAKPGEPADFEEALEILVEQSPYKDAIMKGTGHSGSGARAGNGADGGQKTINREQFEKLSPAEQRSKTLEEGVKVVD